MEDTSTQHTLTVSDKELQRAAQVQIVVDGLAAGRNISQACERAGISTTTWRHWKREGHVAEVINDRYNDVTTGVKDLVADSLVEHVRVLAALATGRIPKGTQIDGVFAPRDAVAAGAQLLKVWQELGGDEISKEREQERILEELRGAHISITQVHVLTANVGTMAQPMPVPVGVLEGEYEEVEDGG